MEWLRSLVTPRTSYIFPQREYVSSNALEQGVNFRLEEGGGISETRMEASHLEWNSNIVHSPTFESAVVKLQRGEEDTLNSEERRAVECFLKPNCVDSSTEETQNNNVNIVE